MQSDTCRPQLEHVPKHRNAAAPRADCRLTKQRDGSRIDAGLAL